MRGAEAGVPAATGAPATAAAATSAAAKLLRIAIERAAAVRPQVDAAELLGVAGDLQDQPELVLVVVDAHPGRAAVGGAEEAPLAADGADQIERGRLGARRRLSEAEGVDLLDLRRPGERLFLRRVVETVKGGQPEIALAAGRGVEAVLSAAVVAAIGAVVLAAAAALGEPARQHQRPLGEVRGAVGALEELPVEQRHRVEALAVDPIGHHARPGGEARAGGPRRALVGGDGGDLVARRPDPELAVGGDGDVALAGLVVGHRRRLVPGLAAVRRVAEV